LRVDAVDFVGLESKADAPVLTQFLRDDDVALKVTLSSTTDLGRLAENKNLNVAFDAASCPLESASELSKWPYVYLSGVEVGYIGLTDEQRNRYKDLAARVSPPQRFEYNVYINSKEAQSTRRAVVSYDLLSRPFDVCLRFSGGNMIGAGLTSNIVQISRSDIIEAEKKARVRRAR
jgi:hypothetical protein